MIEEPWKMYQEKLLAKHEVKLVNERTGHLVFKGFHDEINLPERDEVLPELTSGMKISEDVFGKMKKTTKNIEILELKRMGWLVCSIPSYNPFRFYKTQKRFYYARDEDSYGRRNETIHQQSVKGVIIKMNLKDKTIRLEGMDCGPRGLGIWIRI